jgi:hypothetical protein
MSHRYLLKAARLSSLEAHHDLFFQSVKTELLKVASAPTMLACKLLVVSSFISEGTTSTMPSHSSLRAQWMTRVLDL